MAENIWLGVSRSEPLPALTARITQKAAEYGLDDVELRSAATSLMSLAASYAPEPQFVRLLDRALQPFAVGILSARIHEIGLLTRVVVAVMRQHVEHHAAPQFTDVVFAMGAALLPPTHLVFLDFEHSESV